MSKHWLRSLKANRRPNPVRFRTTIERNKFRLVCEDTRTWYKGSLELNNNCSRNKMDLRINTTAVQTYKGKTAFGIYEIEEDTLVLVAGEPGNTERPYSLALRPKGKSHIVLE